VTVEKKEVEEKSNEKLKEIRNSSNHKADSPENHYM
jgi:hypothetical protein